MNRARAVGGRLTINRRPRLTISRRAATTLMTCTVVAFAVTACETEERRFPDTLPGSSPVAAVRQSPLMPGVAEPDTQPAMPYQETAYAISEGMKFFNWYNCAGCHSPNGGGGMGPPLMDGKWIYGSNPENIYATIMEGRPNGMPSWRGRIPESQVWQIIAYVRTMSGLTPQIARGGRTDHMMGLPGSQALMQKDGPRQSFVPPASEMP